VTAVKVVLSKELKMKIDKTDLKIILALQKNGRASYSELAESLGINVKTVSRRVEALIKSKTIAIRAMPNPFKMGYTANAKIGIRVTPSKIDEVCNQLIDNLQVSLVEKVFGRYEIIIIVYFPEWEMLHDYIYNDLSRIDGVMRVKPYFIKEIIKRYEGFFPKESYTETQIRLRDTEWKLIKELIKDGQANASYLAEKIGTHVASVYRKISTLIDNDILKIIAIPSPGKLFYTTHAHIFLDVMPVSIDTICEKIYNYPELTSIMATVSGSEIIVGVEANNDEKLLEFIKEKISTLKGIRSTETLIRAETIKRYYGWLLDERSIEFQGHE